MNLKYKTGLRRLGAAIIDSLFFIPLAQIDSLLRDNFENRYGLLFWLVIMTTLPFLYSIIMHCRYGQTLGKMVANVKVLNVEETGLLTFKQALFRDSFNILFDTSALLYCMYQLILSVFPKEGLLSNFDSFGDRVALGWILLELLTMLTNRKRRSVHDFIAGSVVVRADFMR